MRFFCCRVYITRMKHLKSTMFVKNIMGAPVHKRLRALRAKNAPFGIGLSFHIL